MRSRPPPTTVSIRRRCALSAAATALPDRAHVSRGIFSSHSLSLPRPPATVPSDRGQSPPAPFLSQSPFRPRPPPAPPATESAPSHSPSRALPSLAAATPSSHRRHSLSLPPLPEEALKLLQKEIKLLHDVQGRRSTLAGIKAQMGVMFYMVASKLPLVAVAGRGSGGDGRRVAAAGGRRARLGLQDGVDSAAGGRGWGPWLEGALVEEGGGRALATLGGRSGWQPREAPVAGGKNSAGGMRAVGEGCGDGGEGATTAVGSGGRRRPRSHLEATARFPYG